MLGSGANSDHHPFTSGNASYTEEEGKTSIDWTLDGFDSTKETPKFGELILVNLMSKFGDNQTAIGSNH